jgi:hypothetical protein
MVTIFTEPILAWANQPGRGLAGTEARASCSAGTTSAKKGSRGRQVECAEPMARKASEQMQ